MADEEIKTGTEAPLADDKSAAREEDKKVTEGTDESVKSDEKTKEGEQDKETAPKAEDKPQQRDRVQERINEITKSRRIAEADAARVREVLKSVTGEEPPKPTDFKTPAEYTEAFMDYATKVKIPEAKLQDAEARIGEADKEYVETIIESWNDRIEAEKAKDPDWEKTVKSIRVKGTPELRLAIMESKLGPKILKYLAQNQDEAYDLESMSPSAQLRRLGYLESKVQVTAPKDVTQKDKVRPNAPPEGTVKGRNATSAKDPLTMSMSEYRKYRGLG